MKKVLIVENRMAILPLCELLSSVPSDVKIGLVVFNPIFQISNFKYNKIYRVKKCRKPNFPQEYPLLNASRSKRYFDIDLDYKCYHEQIKTILDDFNPDLVIGECTQFYETLFIDECIRRKKIYLAPTTTRYPSGRFEFLLFDTDYPLFDKNKINISDANVHAEFLFEGILHNSIKPNSISSNRKIYSKNFLKKLMHRSAYFFRIFLTSLFVENEITPTFYRKIIKDIYTRFLDKKIIKYDLEDIGSSRQFFLYPMQLQPENNIDIFGISFSNQAKLIADLAEFLSGYDLDLYVKPNPILKYQVDKNLVNVVNSMPNVYFLEDGLDIHELLDKALALCSVTGTALIEAAAKNMNVFAFADTRLSRELGLPIIKKIENLHEFMGGLNEIKDYSIRVRSYLANIYRTSYDGHIYDPVREPDLVNDESNIKKLRVAMSNILDVSDLNNIDFDEIQAGINIRFSGKI